MTILEFYDQLKIIPPNLVRHHLEVGAVTQFLLNHWQGKRIDKGLTLRTALLHDVGNLVKYTFPLETRMYHEVIADEAYWHKKHQELVKKYGRDADLVTEQILKEQGFEKEAGLLAEIRLGKYVDKLKDVGYEAKLVFLADGTVSPQGVVGIQARMNDVKKRYAGNEKVFLWVKALKANQRLLQPYIGFDLTKLTEVDFYPLIEKLKNYQLPLAKS